MMRQPLRLALVLGLLLTGADVASAQIGGGVSGRAGYGYDSANAPAISPYLYLLNPNTGGGANGLGTNYFTFTQPMSQQLSNNQQQYLRGTALQNQIKGVNNKLQQGSSALRATGNRGSRMNYSHYYSGIR